MANWSEGVAEGIHETSIHASQKNKRKALDGFSAMVPTVTVRASVRMYSIRDLATLKMLICSITQSLSLHACKTWAIEARVEGAQAWFTKWRSSL